MCRYQPSVTLRQVPCYASMRGTSVVSISSLHRAKSGADSNNICGSFITVVSISAALISGSHSKILRRLRIAEFKNSANSRSLLSSERIEFTVAPADRLLNNQIREQVVSEGRGRAGARLILPSPERRPLTREHFLCRSSPVYRTDMYTNDPITWCLRERIARGTNGTVL